MQQCNPNPEGPASQVEPKSLFRADTDQHGDWYVWRRLGHNGWATMRRCDDRGAAEHLAESLNAESMPSQ